MDTRDTPEQAELRRGARRLARELGPGTVADLDDEQRRKRLAVAVLEAGWLELRTDAGDGSPLASGVEAAIVAEALGEAVADTAFVGPVLAGDLARRAGLDPLDGAVVAFAPDLLAPAVVDGPATREPVLAPDGTGERLESAYVLGQADGHFTLARVPARTALERVEADGSDLTRAVSTIPSGTRVDPVAGATRPITDADLTAWTSLGLALTSADLVGAMRGVLDLTVAYAAERKQYGVAVGSFQAVQHLLADARCLLEGSISVAQHASWAVDNLPPLEACAAGRVAKAYCARAARTVCETAVQVHGGIGNTWECMVHVFLRRALLSSQWFGADGAQLDALAATRLRAEVT